MPGLVRLVLLAALGACQPRPNVHERSAAKPQDAPRDASRSWGRLRGPQAGSPNTKAEMQFAKMRQRMVDEQLVARGVLDPRVLAAMGSVPRHEFVPDAYRDEAYEDTPLPLEEGQTISQPYIVALMTELARVQPGEKVLEVGTGSGYQAAVLAALGAHVFSIEIVEPLARSARDRLRRLHYPVEVRHGDGYAGWPEQAPFDAILITAAAPEVPEPLKQQLALGGRLVAPVGEREQELWVWTRTERGFDRESVVPVRFVPMTGEAQRKAH